MLSWPMVRLPYIVDFSISPIHEYGVCIHSFRRVRLRLAKNNYNPWWRAITTLKNNPNYIFEYPIYGNRTNTRFLASKDHYFPFNAWRGWRVSIRQGAARTNRSGYGNRNGHRASLVEGRNCIAPWYNCVSVVFIGFRNVCFRGLC